MSALDRIWGGQLKTLSIDVAGHAVHLVVSTVSEGVEDVCKIVCSGIREIRFFDESPAVWDYVEITAASATPQLDGSLVLELTMWKEDAGLIIRCDATDIGGELLSFDDC